MSMIGFFRTCARGSFEELADLIKSGATAEADNLISKMLDEMELSVGAPETAGCSGEVFTALFRYLQTVCGVDIRRGTEAVGDAWRSATGDFDVVVFHEKEQVLALEEAMDFEGLSRFLCEFFQADYGTAGQTAWDALVRGLKGTGADHFSLAAGLKAGPPDGHSDAFGAPPPCISSRSALYSP